MGAAEKQHFLSDVAVTGQVPASTQGQALAALLCRYKNVLEIDLPWLDKIVQAKWPQRLSSVLMPNEV